MLDVFSRRIAGWSIADHLRSELVVDALEMARWPTKAAARPDRGPFGSWLAIHGVAFGQPLRASGLLGSTGRLVSALDSAMMESFFGTLQLELLDRRSWTTQAELARAIFEWIECGTAHAGGSRRSVISARSGTTGGVSRPHRRHDP